MTVFDEVKDQLSMSEVVRFYGYEPNSAGFICCPFHNERTGSLKVYDRDFHCFGCGAHGSVIDFVARLFNLDPLSAARIINDNFKLGIDMDKPPDIEQIRKYKRTQAARARFKEWREQMLNQIDQAIRMANLADYRSVTAAEATAIQFRETLEAWADVLMRGSLDEQMQIFRDRTEVERLCRKILNNTQRRSTAA